MMATRWRAAALAAASVLAIGARAPAQTAPADFYKGRQIRLIVGTEAGGGYDAYARVLARFMGRHIPGNPSIVVENMIGAGGVVSANYLYNAAPKDGTVIETFPNDTPFIQIMGQPGPLFEAAKFGWLGSLTSETTVCVAVATAKVKTFADLFTNELIVGGSGPNNTEETPAVLNAVLGTKFRIVTGYASSTATAIAVERGEVEGLCTSYNTIATRNPDWYRDKKVNILVQAALRKNPKIPEVPLAIDMAKNPDDRAVLELNDSPLELGRPFVAPPNLPPDRLQTLRDAFDATLTDPAFIEELAKAKLDLAPLDGSAAQALLERVSKTPKSLIDRLNAALAYRADAIAPAH